MNIYLALSIAAVGGIIVGILIGILSGNKNKTQVSLLKAKLDDAASKAETDKAMAEKRLSDAKEEWRTQSEELRAELDKRHEEAIEAQEKRHKEATEAQEKRHNEAIQAQQDRFDETLEKVKEQMKTATEEMLKQRQVEFANSSNTNIGQIVNPLKETIEKMKKAMEDTTVSQTRISTELKTNMENMIRQSEAAKKSADELTRAFRHESKVQGDWGELVLSEILEGHGLQEGVHFDTQAYIRDAKGNIIQSEEGARMRPDVILHLDTVREVIIDSKVSLSAYIDYVNAADEPTRDMKLKEHVASVKRHVEELSKKDYTSYIQPPKVKMDFVIMFMPHAGAWLTALNAEPDLWRWAFSKKVYVADDQTLYAALRLIDLTWTQIRQADNHQKVYELAGVMLDRVGLFYKEYTKIGDSLAKAKESYDNARKKLEDGGQSICKTAHDLEKLGAKQNPNNPLPKFTDVSDIPQIVS